MKSILTALALVFVLSSASPADGPVVSPKGKLFGLAVTPNADPEALYQVYQNTKANCVMLAFDWGEAGKTPGSGNYNFSSFDNNPLLRLEQEKIVSIRLSNPEAEEIRRNDTQKYRKLAEEFVTAFVKHCNAKGIRYFHAPGDELVSRDRTDWATAYGAILPHIYNPMKAVGGDNILIAGAIRTANEDTVQALYDAGIKPYFDVLAVRTGPGDENTGLDKRSITSARRVMEDNDDAGKSIFVVGGWGPDVSGPTVTADVLRGYLNNGFRNLLTPREAYRPRWILGGMFTYHAGSLNDSASRDLLAAFPPDLPRVSMEGKLVSDSAAGIVYAGQPYPVRLEVANLTRDDIEVLDISLDAREIEGMLISSKSVRKGRLIPHLASRSEFEVMASDEIAGQEALLIGRCLYEYKGLTYLADCWITTSFASRIETNVLPRRLVLKSGGEPETLGLSVINHGSQPLSIRVELNFPEGFTVNPATRDFEISPSGLEAGVFSIFASGATPGNYVAEVRIGHRVTELPVEVVAN